MTKIITRVKSQYGIHARPSAAISIAATRDFPKVHITIDDPECGTQSNANSILGIMMLALPCGKQVIVCAEGEDEENAAKAIVSIIESFEVEVK